MYHIGRTIFECIKHFTTSGYHKECNGSIERQNAVLKSIIRGLADNDLANWPRYLPYAVFVINSQINSSTGYSPHHLMFGYPLQIPTNLKSRPEPVYTYDSYLSELRYKLQIAHTLARESALQSKVVNKLQYDQKAKTISYQVGDKVLITNENRKTKLHNPFRGPYEVRAILSDVNIKIKVGKRDKTIHINRTKLFTKIRK